jgi:hypothetical protein
MNVVRRNIEPLTPTALPPWQATDKRERDQMKEWVIAQLNDQDAEAGMRQHELDAARDYHAPLPEEEQQRLWFDKVIRKARRGDVRALRVLGWMVSQIDPRIAEFIQPLKRVRGRRRSYPRRSFRRFWAIMIVDDVRRVRELWQAKYHKWKRRRGLRPTAAEIIAERRGCTEDDVMAAMKLLSR